MSLKYLFTAGYIDGEIYQQNVEDRSVKEPEKRSCFFDVQHDKLAWFKLKGDGHSYTVDLRDGHFEVDGVSFQMHEEPVSDLRLIFFRHHTHGFNQNREELSHEIVYRFGWQTTVNGENVQRVMQIS